MDERVLLEEVKSLEQRNAYASVISLLEPVIKVANVTLRIKLANAYQNVAAFEQAHRTYDGVLVSHPHNVWGYHGKIGALLKQNLPENALGLSHQALEHHPLDFHLTFQLSQVLVRLDKVSSAIEVLLSLMDKHGDNQNVLFSLANLHLREKIYQEAEQYFYRSLAINERHRPSWVGIIQCDLNQQKFHAVQDICHKALEEFPEDIQIQSFLGFAHLKNRNYWEAETLLEKIVYHEESPPHVKLDYVEALLNQAKKEEVEKGLVQFYGSLITKNTPDNCKVRLSALIANVSHAELFDQTLIAIESDPKSFPLLMIGHLLRMAVNLKRPVEARKLYRWLVDNPTLTLQTTLAAFEALDKTDHEICMTEVKTLESKLDGLNRILFRIESTYQLQGALQAYQIIRDSLNREDIRAEFARLMPIYIDAGKHPELLNLVEEDMNFPGWSIHQQTAYLSGIMTNGAFKKGLSALESLNTALLDLEMPLRINLLKLYYFTGEYEVIINYFKEYPVPNKDMENFLIWALMESGTLVDTSALQYWSDVLTLDVQTRRGKSLHAQIFIDVFHQLNRSASRATKLLPLSIAAKTVTDYFYAQSPLTNHSINVNIPQNIVQYWNEKLPPENIVRLQQTWSDAEGFDHHVFSKIEALTYVREHFDQKYFRALQSCKHPAEQADYFRLLYLSKNGGIYADSDDLLIGNLYDVLTASEGLILYKEPFGVGNNFIAVSPAHPVIIATLNRVTENLMNKTQENIWTKTGPGLLITVLAEYLQYMKHNQLSPDVRILSREHFLKTVMPHTRLPYKNSRRAWSAVHS